MLLCTPVVGLKLGGKVIANSYSKTPQKNNQHTRNGGRAGRAQGQAPRGRGFAGIRSVQKDPLANTTAHETAVQYRNHLQATTVRQTAIPYPGLNPQTQHTIVHQTAPYQNHTVPQVYPTWAQTAEPYQNHNQQVYANGLQTGPYQSHNQVYAPRFQTGPYPNHHHQVYRAGLQPGGTYQIHNQQVYAGFPTDGPRENQQRRKGYTSNHQTNRHAAMKTRYEPVRGQFNNGSTFDSRSQAQR